MGWVTGGVLLAMEVNVDETALAVVGGMTNAVGLGSAYLLVDMASNNCFFVDVMR